MEQSPSPLPLVPHYGPTNHNHYYGNYLLPQVDTAQQQVQPAYQQQAAGNQRTSPPPFEQTSNVDLLDDIVPPNGYPPRPSTPPPAQLVQRDGGISEEIIASQERALAEIRRQQQQATTINTSQSLTVPVRVPRSSNPNGSDAIHPQKQAMKRARKEKTVVGVALGAVVGGLIGLAFLPIFPLGVVLGGAVGGLATNKLSKAGERRVQRKWEQQSFQRGAQESMTVQRDGSFV